MLSIDANILLDLGRIASMAIGPTTTDRSAEMVKRNGLSRVSPIQAARESSAAPPAPIRDQTP